MKEVANKCDGMLSQRLDLLSLPDVVLEKILLYLSYDEIAHTRIVCKRLDTICRLLLNKGFIAAERCHAQSLKSVKVLLPRRESERRSHPMARHCDILTAIETRLSMLSMTFVKYVDGGLCCFIPGKVIDEIFRVLKLLKESKTPPRAHEILQELRDISSMAMEHFDEKIAPAYKNKRTTSFPTYTASGTSGISSSTPRPLITQEKLRLEFQKFQMREQRNRSAITSMRLKMKRMNQQLNSQARKLHSQAGRISEQEAQIAEMKRTLVEWDHKFGDVAAELSCVREENSVLAAALGVVFNPARSAKAHSSNTEKMACKRSSDEPCQKKGCKKLKVVQDEAPVELKVEQGSNEGIEVVNVKSINSSQSSSVTELPAVAPVYLT